MCCKKNCVNCILRHGIEGVTQRLDGSSQRSTRIGSSTVVSRNRFSCGKWIGRSDVNLNGHTVVVPFAQFLANLEGTQVPSGISSTFKSFSGCLHGCLFAGPASMSSSGGLPFLKFQPNTDEVAARFSSQERVKYRMTKCSHSQGASLLGAIGRY